MTANDTDLADNTGSRVSRTLIAHRRVILKGALLLSLVAAGLFLFNLDEQADEPKEFYLIEVATLDGGSLPFSSLAGKPVLLNFFASWCPPCVAEMPTIEALHQEFADQMNFVGLAFESAQSARSIVAETGVTYLTGLDEDGVLLAQFEGIAMPTTVFIDSEGTIVETHIGELSDAAFREKFKELFGIGDT